MATTARSAISFNDYKWKLFYAEQLKHLEDDLKVDVDLVDIEENEEAVEKQQIKRLKEHFQATLTEKDEKILSLVKKTKEMKDQFQATLAEKDERILNLLEELRTIRTRACDAPDTFGFTSGPGHQTQSAYSNDPHSGLEKSSEDNLEPSEQTDSIRHAAFSRTGSVKHRKRQVFRLNSPNKSTNLKRHRTESGENSLQCQSCPRKFFTQRQLRFHKKRRHGVFQTKFPFKEFTEAPEWNSIPKVVHNIIGDLVKDKYHLHYGILSKGLTLNYIKAGSDEAENLEKILRDADAGILNSIVGHYYLNSTSTENESHPVINTDETTLSKRTRLEKGSGELWVSDEVWEKAYDASKNAATQKVKIENSARILFDAVMTEDEIERGTFSGKKNTEKFDNKKIRWIKAACVYIMKRPDKSNRNMTSFEKDWVAGKLDMSARQEELIKEHVFCGHAYRQRKKLLSSKVAENSE